MIFDVFNIKILIFKEHIFRILKFDKNLKKQVVTHLLYTNRSFSLSNKDVLKHLINDTLISISHVLKTSLYGVAIHNFLIHFLLQNCFLHNFSSFLNSTS